MPDRPATFSVPFSRSTSSSSSHAHSMRLPCSSTFHLAAQMPPADILHVIWQRRWRVEAAERIQRAVRRALDRDWGKIPDLVPDPRSFEPLAVFDEISVESRGILHAHMVTFPSESQYIHIQP
jgi:hypothetical protein